MSQYSNKSLDDWNTNDVDDGEIGWAEDDVSLEDEAIHQTPLRPHTRNVKSSRPDIPEVVRRVPQFIMPSIGESQPRQRAVSRKFSQTDPAHSQSKAASTRTTPQKVRRQRVVHREDVTYGDRTLNFVLGLLGSVLDVFADTIKLLKTPITYILAGYAILIFLQLTQNLITQRFYAALTPVCRLPGVGYLDLAICRPFGSNHPTLPAGADVPEPEFDSLMKIQGQFETIMEETSNSLSLPADMKRSEVYLRDLRQVVKFSSLPSRNELMHEFDGFIETAGIASYDLQRFHSHVGRGVDIVLSTAKWTSRVLDDINHEVEQKGLLPAFISETLLAPFKPLKFTEARALDQYIQHSHVVSREIESLIEEAQTLLNVLHNLEDRLEVIHEVALQDNINVQDQRDEILADIWSFLGGNKAKRRKLDVQMSLLVKVTDYRKLAVKHILDTVVKLQEMGAELEELRGRVGSAAVMKEAGMTHVPLEVHIENIRLGVERLEIGRQKARELEKKHQRSVLDRADANAAAGDIRFISS